MRRLLTRGGAFALALVAVPCASFDTGLHSTLTRESMLQEGFELGPTNMGVVMNWLVDYYASSDVTNKRVHAECEKLHFDNLFLTKSVANYWDRLAVNAERGCKQAVREGDPYRLLSLIGMSLHAVQDFYTHSNWLDYYPPAPTEEYQTVSWWDDAKRTEKLVYTGGYPNNALPRGAVEKHGSNFTGLNKDNHDRHLWLPAYVLAYKASRQWIRAMEEWTDNRDLWNRAKEADLTRYAEDLGRDGSASMLLSMWARKGSDPSLDHEYVHGRWKEWGSGDRNLFAGLFAGWANRFTVFQNEFLIRKTHEILTKTLHGLKPAEVPVPIVPSVELKRKLVVLRTTSVVEQAVGAFERRADVNGTPDYYALVSLHQWRHQEATRQDGASFSPEWTSLEFVPADLKKVRVEYALFDEDNLSSEACDVDPKKNDYTLKFDFDTKTHDMSGDLAGQHDTPDSAVASKGGGDKNRAEVKIFMYTAKVADEPKPGGAMVIVQVHRVAGLDAFDNQTQADFFPRWGFTYEPFWHYEMYVSDTDPLSPRWFLRSFTRGKKDEHEFQLEVYDQDGDSVWWAPSDSDQADLVPAKGRRQLRFKVNIKTLAITGDVIGKVGDRFTLKGDASPRAKIEFTVLMRPNG